MSQDNREIRVFISSTFSDMRVERDYLNKHVFPGLRKMCQQRGVIFTEVDLQWGITEGQAEDGGAIEVCLDEINRCHPYFIGLLGERYGWSPKDSGLSSIPVRNDDLKKQVREWSEAGESVTAMEIMHGVLDNPKEAPYAYFYFRNSECTDTLSGQERTSDYYDDDLTKKQKLKCLKNRILEEKGDWHVRNEEGGYCSIKFLGELIKTDLEAAINERFPESEVLSPLQHERNMHAAFAQSRLSINKPDEPSSYIVDDKMMGCLFRHFELDDVPIVITGDMGSGKSALLANFAARWKERNKGKESYAIEHYAGSGGESDAVGVLRRIMAEIKVVSKIDGELPLDDEGVYQELASWLLGVPTDTKYLLLLDGVNQLTGKDGELNRLINAFPQHVGSHINIIISTLDGEVLDSVNKRNWVIKKVSPLSVEQRKELVSVYLQHFRKILPNDLLMNLIESNASQNPLYLRIIIDELRVDAKHDELALRLENYLLAKDPEQLFTKVLSRWERDYGLDLVKWALGLIWTSRYGLSESELRSILWPSLYKKDDLEDICRGSPLQLSTLFYGMGDYLSNREGLYNFMHDALRQAVDSQYINNKIKQTCHQLIASYFAGVEVSQRQVDELPWHWVQLEAREELVRYLYDVKMFKVFSVRSSWLLELSFYWRKAEYDIVKASTYLNEKLLGLEPVKYIEAAELIGSFYSFMGLYLYAEETMRTVLEMRKDFFGDEHLDVACSLSSLGLTVADQGRFEEANKLCTSSFEMRSKLLGKNHPLTLKSIDSLAYVMDRQGKYKEAEGLYRKSLELRKAILGGEHQDVLTSLHGVAFEQDNQGKLSEAESIYRQLLEIRTRKIGKNHPDTVKAMNNLAYCKFRQKQYEESHALGKVVVEDRKLIFGDKHPLTLNSRFGYSWGLMKLGRIKESEANFEHLLRDGLEVFGNTHPFYITYLFGYGTLLEVKGLFSKAEEVFRDVLDIRYRELGNKHPNTEISFGHLTRLLESQNRFEDALKLKNEFPSIKYTDSQLEDTS